tara:strand:+ start:339 stop:476 length:138 start_codon:yes stop_codon:yes gene_type:complete
MKVSFFKVNANQKFAISCLREKWIIGGLLFTKRPKHGLNPAALLK